MTSRRAFIGTSALLALAAALPLPARAQGRPAAQALAALLDETIGRWQRNSPELVAALGLDHGDLAWTKSLLSDASAAAIADSQKDTRDLLGLLNAIDRRALTGMDAVNYDTVEFVFQLRAKGDQAFTYGGGGAGAPYTLSQLTGAYQSIPDFLDNQHAITTVQDADDYLARMVAFGRLMDQETEAVTKDFAMGVVPPDFVIDKTLVQMRGIASTSSDKAPIVQSLIRRAKAAQISGSHGVQAGHIYDEVILPALRRQIACLESARATAPHDAGVWRLPKGADYYALSLKQYTTSNLTPDEIHQLGLETVATLTKEADKIMRAIGLRSGTVGQRYRQMYDDPKYRYPNTDAGKTKLLADLNAQIKVIQAKLPTWFGTLPKSGIEVRRVPPAIEAGAPGGSYDRPSLDGKRPGIYWINLRDTSEVPGWTLPTLTYHEAIPGHHLQISLANEAASLPLIRKVIGFSGYQEGWALYAEELAVEMGLYAKDPLGHLGMLHDALFRAVRLVVDSGMHHKRWSREQAIAYYVATIGDQEASAVTEIERYAVWPGQACSYMVGKLTWMRLRAKARKALGARFDIRAFHDAGLLSGAVPLTVLERVIDDYIAAASAAKLTSG